MADATTFPRKSDDNVVPLFGMSQRLPPTAVLAEQALLGAILANNKAHTKVSDFLRPEHFADPINGRIFKAVSDFVNAGRLADAVTLTTHFENSGVLAEVGGTPYLAQLLSAMVGIISAGEYGRAIYETWQRRRLIEAGESLVNAAFDGTRPITEMGKEALQAVDALLGSTERDRGLWTIGDAVDQALRVADARAKGDMAAGLMTGMSAVDQMLGGLEDGTLTILAGRPGSGKSAMGHQWALHAAGQGVRVQEYSLEMSAVQLGRRALAVEAKVPIWQMRMGRHAAAMGALLEARKRLLKLPLVITDASGLSAPEIAARARAIADKHGAPGLVMIDHLHIMEHDANTARQGAHLAIGQTTRLLKSLAKSLACPVLLLAQLKRPAPGNEGKRPTMTDLRQSGNIEEDADVIAIVHREEMHIEKAPTPRAARENEDQYAARVAKFRDAQQRSKGIAELLIEKGRDGATGIITLRFDGPTATFRDPTQADDALAGEDTGGW